MAALPVDPPLHRTSPPSRDVRARRHALLLGTSVVAACAIAAASALAYFGDDGSAPPPPERVAAPAWPVPSPIDFFTDPPASPEPGATLHQPVRPPVKVATWSPRASRSPSPSPSPSPTPALTAGRTVSLALADDKALLVRHREFLARVERSPGEDARFTVRAGLADKKCLSLEAAGLPGYFLRHRDYVVRLEPRDPTPLYAADATFCAAGDRRITLRSHNYPHRSITVQNDVLHITGDPAAEFVVLP